MAALQPWPLLKRVLYQLLNVVQIVNSQYSGLHLHLVFTFYHIFVYDSQRAEA